jgi:hypothetical protein
MPLELDAEELSSLDGHTRVEGEAIVKLLQHYNADVASTTVDEIPASSMDTFNAQLQRVKSSTPPFNRLLVMHVNALNKDYNGERNHYVGLLIEKRVGAGGGYTVQYIDPMSHEMNPTIREIITTELGDIPITEYTGKLQYAVKEEVGFREGDNDHDCGPMLAYLLTLAAHDRELPALGEEEVERSKLIGQGLRTIFLGDNGKEIGVSTNIANLSLSDIEARVSAVIAPSSTLLASKGATIAVHSGDILSSVLRDSEHLLTRTSANPDLISRRLDSLARLITGRDVCAAVAFDGERILFANNNNNNTLLENPGYSERSVARNVFLLLSYIAKNNLTQAQIDSSPIPQIMENLVSTAVQEYRLGSKRVSAADLALYEARIRRDINKLVNSLAIDGDRTKKFPENIREAFKRGIEGSVEFVPGREVIISDKSTGKEEDRSIIVHAEMAILDRVITPDAILVRDEDVATGRKPFYVGITMLCCRDCRNAIVAFNEVSGKTPVPVTGSSPPRIDDVTFHTIGTRGQHLMQFPWGPPRFFELRPAIRAKYEEIVRKLSRRRSVEPGKPLSADLSGSDSEPNHTTISIRRSAAESSTHSYLEELRSLLAATSVRSGPQAPAPAAGTHERSLERKK